MIPFESLGTLSYLHFIVSMAQSCIISKIKQDICRTSQFFSYPVAFDDPVRGSPFKYCHYIWCGKARMLWLPDSEKGLRYV